VTLQTLAGIEVFRYVPHHTMEALSRCCRWRWFDAHQTIVHEDDKARDVFFVVRGKACAIHYAWNGRAVRLRDLAAGEMFGELSAINCQSEPANLVAVSNTLIARMAASLFCETLRNCEPLGAAVMQGLAEQVRLISYRAIELSTFPVRSRIHAELLRLSCKSPTDQNVAIISPVPTHTEIANRIHSHREYVTRQLNDLARVGLIKRECRRLVICDVAGLLRMLRNVVGDVHLRAVNLE
jgi:CRP-like cAMP-binding protein